MKWDGVRPSAIPGLGNSYVIKATSACWRDDNGMELVRLNTRLLAYWLCQPPTLTISFLSNPCLVGAVFRKCSQMPVM
jgi:hypothetical protein